MITTKPKIVNNRKILVICRQVLHEYLQYLSNDGSTLISYVETISEAMNILPTLRADVIVSEIELSDSNIWQLAESLNSGLCTSKPAVIVLTFEEQTIAVQKKAQSKSIHLYDEEIPFSGLSAYINQVELTRKKLLNNKNVLVIEDDKRVIDAIAHVLGSEFNLEYARQGREGLAKWDQKNHDLVILDLGLPDIDGLSVLKQIIAKSSKQPILVLTGLPKEDNLKICMLSGAQTFLAKPIEPQELIKQCHRALNWFDLERIHEDERQCEQVFRLIGAATNLLQTGHINESNVLLKRVGSQISAVSVHDDDYFTT